MNLHQEQHVKFPWRHQQRVTSQEGGVFPREGRKQTRRTRKNQIVKMPNQEEILAELGIPGGVATVSGGGGGGGNRSGVNADDLGNDATMEGLWAMKAMEHAEIHFNLLCAVDPRMLKLTPKDDVIYKQFRKDFPDFDVTKLDVDALKSSQAKEKWRPFCMEFEKEIEDYSFATLVRLDPTDEYSEPNTLIVTRIQFFCIEVARNREGHNDSVRTKFKPRPRTKKVIQ